MDLNQNNNNVNNEEDAQPEEIRYGLGRYNRKRRRIDMDSTSSSSTSFSTISTLMHEASCIDSMSARYRAYMPPDKDIHVDVKKCYVNGTDNLFGNHLNQKLLKQANGLNYKLIKGESKLNWAQEVRFLIIITL
uniref:Uncharacterized protein n=1 Tax=Panagrolaimus superbus TaxID=310955 RepID=A0A914YGY9_9BILA